MKRTIVFCLCLLVFVACAPKKDKGKETSPAAVQAPDAQKAIAQDSRDEYQVEIQDEYLGVYLPVEYIDNITEYKNHSVAIHSANANYYNFLNVTKNIIYSDVKWHDGYAIESEVNDLFKYISDGENYTIIDDKGYKYIRISSDTVHAYKVIDGYVMNVILQPLIKQKKLEIVDGKLDINGTKYEVVLDDMFYPKDDNLLFFNRETKTMLGMKITGKSYIFYKLIPSNEDMGSVNSDEIIYQIDED